VRARTYFSVFFKLVQRLTTLPAAYYAAGGLSRCQQRSPATSAYSTVMRAGCEVEDRCMTACVRQPYK